MHCVLASLTTFGSVHVSHWTPYADQVGESAGPQVWHPSGMEVPEFVVASASQAGSQVRSGLGSCPGLQPKHRDAGKVSGPIVMLPTIDVAVGHDVQGAPPPPVIFPMGHCSHAAPFSSRNLPAGHATQNSSPTSPRVPATTVFPAGQK